MKIFISWSGPRSKEAARALHGWLPTVIQSVQPWMSAEDIKAGARWGVNVAAELEQTKFGIICVTPENQHAPWILFEAGALAKTLDNTYVCPYLIDLTPSQLQGGPLTQFQAKQANKQQSLELVRTINRALKEGCLPEDRLEKTFDRFWPDLDQAIKDIPPANEPQKMKRSSDDIVEEVLEVVRDISRSIADEINPRIAAQERESSLLRLMMTSTGMSAPGMSSGVFGMPSQMNIGLPSFSAPPFATSRPYNISSNVMPPQVSTEMMKGLELFIEREVQKAFEEANKKHTEEK